MNIFIKGIYFLTFIGYFFGIKTFIDTLNYANGAPQQAAGAAMSLVYIIVSYCIARSFEKIFNVKK